MKEKIRAVAGIKSCNRPLFLKSGGINYEDQYQRIHRKMQLWQRPPISCR